MAKIGPYFRIAPEDWIFANFGDVMGAKQEVSEFLKNNESLEEIECKVEEFVRQWAIRQLIAVYGYPKKQIEIEKRISRNEVDVVVKDKQGRDFIFVETKKRLNAAQLISAEGQLKKYMTLSPEVVYGMVTDGDQTRFLEKRKQKMEFDIADDLPSNRDSVAEKPLTQGEEWRKTIRFARHFEPEMTPEGRRHIREFIKRFPKENLRDLTLDDYAQGKGSKDSFCYRLQFKNDLGLVQGGDAKKWGVYWDKHSKEWWFDKEDYKSPGHALKAITGKLAELVEAFEGKRFEKLDMLAEHKYLGTKRWPLRTKPLYFYFPQQFLPVHSDRHLKRFLAFFGLPVDGGAVSRNLRLLDFLHRQRESRDLDTQNMMFFLYHHALVPGTESPTGRRKRGGE